MIAYEKFSTLASRLGAKTTRSFFEASHNGFALLGLAVMFAVVALTVQPQIRDSGERYLMGWLQNRQSSQALASTSMAGLPDASDRATATNPSSLPKPQAALAYWLSKKYRVAPEPVSALVAEAFSIADTAKVDATLILAVMAVESGFNPFAQSAVGAQGLMQVLTRVHSEKYDNFGGKLAAFDPVANLRVGVRVLQDCISRAGSIEAGLRAYVGATNLEDDGGYAAKVLAEQARLKLVSLGRLVPTLAAATSLATGVVALAVANSALLPANQAAILPAALSAPGKPKSDAAGSDKLDSLQDS